MKTFFYKYGLIAYLIVGVSQLAVGQTFFGTTRAGGTTGGGTIFRVNADGSGLTTDYNFQVDANPGRGPDYAQMVLVNGLLYGVMPNGGKNDTGLLFSYNPIDNTYTKKIDFDDQVLTGWGPIGTLCLANGKLYGTTKEGGTKYNGTIFQYDPTNNTFTKKVDFDKTISGSTPLGGLTSATNGKFYGMTIGGGANDKGVLFEYDGSSTVTKKIDFDGLLKGSLPLRNLKEAGGKLYGMTVAGGINDKGVLSSALF